MSKKQSPLPGALATAVNRFESWRENRTSRRIPEALWKRATKLSATYGVCRTAQALRLDYAQLKRRVEALNGGDAPEATPVFAEFQIAGRSVESECVVELDNADGLKMRVHVKGTWVPDMDALNRLFWGERR